MKGCGWGLLRRSCGRRWSANCGNSRRRWRKERLHHERLRDTDFRADQVFWRQMRGARAEFERAAGVDLRVSGAQWVGKDDELADDPGVACADVGEEYDSGL